MEQELKQHIRNRGSIKAKLTNFVKFLQPIRDAFSSNKTIDERTMFQLRFKVDNIDDLLQQFEAIQIDIEYLCNDADLQLQYDERDTFTNLYCDTVADAKFILKKLNIDKQSNTSIVSNSNRSNKSDNSVAQSSNHSSESNRHQNSEQINNSVKLPTISLPTFSGNYNKWLEFKDTFESLIHSNSTINAIQKFHYLRASLQGEALKVIQSIEFSADNYNVAWDLLCNRYNNKGLLIHNHVKALFSLETLSKETSIGLRNLLDTVLKHLRALESLGQPTHHWDTLLIFIISSKLDKVTAREWEQYKLKNEVPILDDITEFLKSKANLLETLEINHNVKLSKEKEFKQIRHTSLLTTNAQCNLCKQNHLIYTCPQFLELNVSKRIDKVKELKLCMNCLRIGHNIKQCRSGPCKVCKNKHNSLIHITEQKVETTPTNETVSLTTQSCLSNYYVFLSTVSLFVVDSKGSKHECKAILDSGSQSNFICNDLCSKLQLTTSPVDIQVSSFYNAVSNHSSKCNVTIQSRVNNFSTTISCITVPSITHAIPYKKLDIDINNLPSNIQLADPTFYMPSTIHILIGASLFWDLIKSERVHLGKHNPVLQNTVFGYIASGAIKVPTQKSHCFLTRQNDLQDDLQKFWEIENCDENSSLSHDDEQCEKHFKNTTFRDKDGRFVVQIPFKYSPSNLGESKSRAIKRLQLLENRFKANPDLKTQYANFINEYKNLSHMTQITKPDFETKLSYFLPHHGVLREDSLTTKLRVVFDGSAPSSSGWSLNDLQYTGPTILNDIFAIHIRFRQHSIVVTADIAKMYRQILVNPNDRSLQRICWRENSYEDVSVYELNTVTYGTASAPYIAVRCIKQLAMDCEEQYPLASKIIANDFYVDDLITGFDSEEEAILISQQVTNILKSACFSLRKWNSNNENLLDSFKDDNEPLSILSLGDKEMTKTLGIQWLTKDDSLTYHISKQSNNTTITKRSILSDVAKLFDPLGLISPCIIFVKILIQKLWSLKIDWDEPVPEEVKVQWQCFRQNLPILNTLSIKRHVICQNAATVELHGFCDASQHAYGACVYVRSIDQNNHIHINLLCSKTKVAPLKVQTIPRLELCSAVMLTNLMSKVKGALAIECPTYFWCDSQVTLYWIRTEPFKLKTFVKNRVSKIRSATSPLDWHYINTNCNPADLASRGTQPNVLANKQIWWNGPNWLALEKQEWPKCPLSIPTSEIPEINAKSLTLIVQENHAPFDLFSKYSTLTRLKSIFAYCLRFIWNCRSKHNKGLGNLTVQELDNSMKVLVKLAQKESFSGDISILKSERELPSKHKLLSLSPFLDSDGLIRVGGRLKNSNLNFDAKHPLLLNGKHPLTQLILEHKHKELLHAPPQLLLSSVRQNYWPTRGIDAAKKVVHNCLKCFKFRAKPSSALMADLPKNRVISQYPFFVSGVDYAGPFILKDRKGRGAKLSKAYICLFVCFAKKAMHLELVTELSTSAFIAALRRFSSRRGKPNRIYSDHGTNFVGAQKELAKLYEFLQNENQNFISNFANENITWECIPPRSPHFGGLWESGVKSVKSHLIRVIGNAVLTYEEFLTVIVQIEAILNSRPLCPLSSDPNDFEPLTPSHFLIGRSLVMVPDPNLQEIPVNRLSRYQLLQQIQQSFWARWHRDYLNTLQQRNKWKVQQPNIPIGTLVLIKDDNLPPCSWQLGRIVSVHPGDGGTIRVVTVRTSKGQYTRSISKICQLPVIQEPAGSDVHEQFESRKPSGPFCNADLGSPIREKRADAKNQEMASSK